MTNLDSILKSRGIIFLTKVPIVKAMIFPVVMYGCESWTTKKDWALKNWCFQTVILEKTLECLLYSEEIKAVNPKENQPWVFIERTDAEAPILWLPDAKSQLIGKHPDAGKDWEQKEKRVADVEMAGLYHQLIRHEFEQTLRDSEDREAWHALAHGFTKSQTQVSDWTTIYNEHTRKGKQTK